MEEKKEQEVMLELVDDLSLKTRAYWFCNDFNFETIDKLSQELESLFTCTNKIELYLTSQGGETPALMYILDFLNKNKDKVKLIANYGILSAGFFLFVHYEGEKEILPCTTGMLHTGSMTMDIHELKNKHGHENFYLKKKAIDDEFIISPIKDKLTKDELRRYYKGEDVFVSEERLRQLIE